MHFPARYIDHTLLQAQAGEKEIRKLCQEAKQYGFFSVCVAASFVPLCVSELSDCNVRVCTVIGFPLGSSASEVKAFETKTAVAQGADEVDMVIHIGKLKDGDDDYVRRDIEAVVAATEGKAVVKVIIETALLTEEEKIRACFLAESAGANYVKTSTGFAASGANIDDVALMRKTVPNMGIKASGGIRTLADAMAMVEQGATRIGVSASVAIMQEAEKKQG